MTNQQKARNAEITASIIRGATESLEMALREFDEAQLAAETSGLTLDSKILVAIQNMESALGNIKEVK